MDFHRIGRLGWCCLLLLAACSSVLPQATSTRPQPSIAPAQGPAPSATVTTGPATPQPAPSARPTPTPRLTADGWQETLTAHLRLRYYPGSPAARDIDQIMAVGERAYERANSVIPVPTAVHVTVYLVPRVFWQGGVTYDGDTVLLTYADRNYAGVELWSYLVHELVHALANHYVQRGSEVGGLLGEGVAVYAAGGHYGVEPVERWAAALAAGNDYLPLCTLRTAWGEQQHEIAYLEAASFVDYLIHTYGSARFLQLYAHAPALPPALLDRQAWCAGQGNQLLPGVDRRYDQLEQEWRASLRQQTPGPDDVVAVHTQIRLYDLMRRYQEQRDPAARVLPPPPARWTPGLRTAFSAPAITPTAVLQEALLVAAKRSFDQGRQRETSALLDEIKTSIATNALTGTVGLQYAGMQATLDAEAAAVRRHDRAAFDSVTTADGPAWPPERYTDYRWTMNAVTLSQNEAVVEATLASRGAQSTNNAPYRLTLRRSGDRWRIARTEPAPIELHLPPPVNDIAERNGAPWPLLRPS